MSRFPARPGSRLAYRERNDEEKADGQIFPGLAIGRAGGCSGPDLLFHGLTAAHR
jgi:hypothetical protein